MSNALVLNQQQSSGLQVLGMKISTLTEAMQLAEYFAKSDLVPKDYRGKPGNIVVAWQKGYEVGLLPQQSLETIAVINGRACIWGDGLIALVKNSPKEEWTKEWLEGKGDEMVAFCETKRKNQANTIKRSFSVAQSKKAGLWGNNTWNKYPERMLQMRARGFCLRDAYPDVFNGLQLAEEQLDAINIDVDINEIEKSIKDFGLELIKKNGIATIKGNAFSYGKILKELGFKVVNNVWTISYQDEEDIVDIQVQEKAKIPENPANELFMFLKEKGLNKEEIKNFAEFLGVSSKENEKIKNLLKNKAELENKIKQFFSFNDEEMLEEVF